jgi:DNA invertase Pin-like site-specific DNA recombinase
MARNPANVGTSVRGGKEQLINSQALIPAAQYVRMSDEAQEYSIDNQKAAIRDYAIRHGFVIVKTYADPGKSGVVATHRKGLSDLLHDVVAGDPPFRAILVYDVSRWGRYQNSDEAAHYEFLCVSSGIPLHYCAEPFANDGTAMSTLFKALKRSMAAEYSRELSEKEFRGKSRIAELGFWVGGNPAYGYRRMMFSANGTRKQILERGEQKSLRSDRVVLVPGPVEEVECVQSIFSMASQGESCRSIAGDLNRRGSTHFGRRWLHGAVYQILKNPMYAGHCVWNRTTTRMRTSRRSVPTQEWIAKSRAFQPIVDQQIFERVQVSLRRRFLLSRTRLILKRVRRILKTKGHLSQAIIQGVAGLPSSASIRRMFGSYRRLYQKVGYQLSPVQELRSDRLNNSIRLRRELIEKIEALFPNNIVISHLPDRRRSVLLVDQRIIVSILFCSPLRRRGKYVWIVEPNPAEREYITLVCLVKRSHERVLGYFVYPHLNGFKTHFMSRNDPFQRAAVRLRNLAEFYTTVNMIWNNGKS